MPWMKLPDGGVAHLCIRGKAGIKATCAHCRHWLAELECDGCDKRLCRECAVSPKDELDFCPTCFRPAFEYFKTLGPVPTEQLERRTAFRAWARANAELFLHHAQKRTAESLKAVPAQPPQLELLDAKPTAPTPAELWKRANGDAQTYRELMLEHGHLVPKAGR